MKRRRFLAFAVGLGGWPAIVGARRRAARLAVMAAPALLVRHRAAAQSALPAVGYLGSETPEVFASRLASFRSGLAEVGLVEGRDFVVLYRWAESRNERLPALAAELVAERVKVLAAPGSVAAGLAAKAATATVPVVFETGADPVASGLVGSLSRPGGNVTGVSSLNAEVLGKRIELLRTLVPSGQTLALVVNPRNPVNRRASVADGEAAARRLGLRLLVVEADHESAFAAAFEAARTGGADMMAIANDTLFNRPEVLAGLAGSFALPAAHQSPEFCRAGGLTSYGGAVAESHRLAGVYVGRLLKGERPGDLPVQQVTKVLFAINVRTARSLGLLVPLDLLSRADEVID